MSIVKPPLFSLSCFINVHAILLRKGFREVIGSDSNYKSNCGAASDGEY